MEMTTVSPSPASPTEGDDLCEIDGTKVAIHSVTLLICLCGLVGNGAVLCLLSLKVRNTGIFDLAFADFILLLFTGPAALLFLVEDVSCSSIISPLYLSFLLQLSVVCCYCPLIRLLFTNSILDIYMICGDCDLPERLLWLMDSVRYWAFFALFTVIPAVSYLCPSHQQGPCRAALISMYVLILLLFVAPMVISILIRFTEAICGSKNQQPKRHAILIFLIVLSILLVSICNFLQPLGYTVVSSDLFLQLNSIHSSIKPFIYFLAGRCYSLRSLRFSLWRVFDE